MTASNTDATPRRLRVLWLSDAPWAPSGYGVQSALTVPRLAAHCDIAFGCTYGLHGGEIVYNGVTVYPGGADPFANDVIASTAKRFGADVVITLKDLPVFQPNAFAGLRWAPMIPVDHEPAPPAVANIARYSWAPIAYAPNGVRELSKIGLMPYYAPHAFDEALTHAVDRNDARDRLGIARDAFVVATVAVNRGGMPSRKAWPELVEGFKGFAATMPNAVWAAHTYLGDDGFEGSIPLRSLLGDAMNRVLFAEPEQYKRGYPADYLRYLYSAADVLLAPSLGEGFGVPVLEAQACGTPVIVSDWAATADLCFAGVKIPRDHAYPYFSNQQARQHMPQPYAITAALQHMAALTAEQRAEMQRNAIAATRPFEISAVVENHWKPILEHMAARINRERVGRGVLKIVTSGEVLA